MECRSRESVLDVVKFDVYKTVKQSQPGKTTTDVFDLVPNSNRTELKLDGNVHTTYNYNTANLLTTLTDDVSQNFLYSYDPVNDVLSDPNFFRNFVAAMGAAAAAVPSAPLAVGAAGAAAIYGAAHVGIYTAAHPSNPVVKGPWPLNPFKPPFGYPVPAYPPTSTIGRPYCEPGPKVNPFPWSIP